MQYQPKYTQFAICVLISLCFASTAIADGVIIPVHPLPQPIRLGELYSVKYHRVFVEIQDQVATTTVEQAFINETGNLVEVEYVFPLPRNSQVNKFSLIVDDKEIEGRILRKEEARRIYESIVRRQRDPALLEYIGNGMFRTNVFPLPPGGERAVKLIYTELLTPDGNQVEYRYPLNTEKFSKKVLEEVRIDFKLKSKASVKNVYSPTHDLKLGSGTSHSISGHWSEEGIRPAHDFRLFWSLSEEDIGATLFTYRPDKSEDGYFLFLASPEFEVDIEKIIAKNVVMVLDVSGSMRGEKIDQARGAARFITRNIGQQDNFNIIFYNSMIDPLWDDLKPFNESNKIEAISAIENMEAGGGTNIHGALTTAMKQFPGDNRPNYIIFLTDGLPTSGITELDKITDNVLEENRQNCKLFAFGVGYDVNAVLLDRLGAENHGMAEYVPPGEDIEAKVSSFYSKIQNPALTDISLDFGSLRIRDRYPSALPDLFHRGQLILTGRYRDSGKAIAKLSGLTGEQKQTFSYKLNFARQTDREEFAFVARLWAQKKIGWLIEQIRFHGQKQEYVDEIVALSTRYGIMTQYTSFLAEEDVEITDWRGHGPRVFNLMAEAVPQQSGSAGVSQSMQSGRMKKQSYVAPQAQYYDASGQEVTVDRVKIIGSKTFYLKKDGWIDAELKEGVIPQEITQLSEEFYELANKWADQAKYLTFSPDEAITVVIAGTTYKILPAN